MRERTVAGSYATFCALAWETRAPLSSFFHPAFVPFSLFQHDLSKIVEEKMPKSGYFFKKCLFQLLHLLSKYGNLYLADTSHGKGRGEPTKIGVKARQKSLQSVEAGLCNDSTRFLNRRQKTAFVPCVRSAATKK